MLQTGSDREDADLEKLIRLAISDIHALKQEATLQFALRAGEVVVRRFFGGDIRKLRRRGPKDLTICRLAEHPDLPISTASLYVAVQVFELVDRLGGPEAYRDLHLSHYRAVLPAPQDTQKRLLDQAADNAWSVARLRSEVGATGPQADRAAVAGRRAVVSRRFLALVDEAARLNDLDPAVVAPTFAPAELERAATAAQEIVHFIRECLLFLEDCMKPRNATTTTAAAPAVTIAAAPAVTLATDPERPRSGSPARNAPLGVVSGGGVHLLR